MKMREWFGSDTELTGNDIARGFVSPSQYQAAAHAVNCHDAMVELLTKILTTYELDHDDTSSVLRLLKKAGE